MAASTSNCRRVVIPELPGLSIYYDLVSEAREQELLDYITAQPWPPTPTMSGRPLKRKTQHYGHRYSYSAGHIDEKAPPIEGVLKTFIDHISMGLHFEFNQVIVNKYKRTDGIAAHIDTTRYGEKIITLSLEGDCVMTFSREGYPDHNLYLPRRSLVILTGDARYKWKHGISSKVKKSHLPVAGAFDPLHAGRVAARPTGWRRVSVTARHQ